MALKTWVTGSTYDDHIGTTAFQGGNSNFTAAGVTSAGFTAPNLTNKITGVWIFFTTVPTTVNAIVEVQESTVTKVSATINNADIKQGWNYVRFATPYQFATLTASAYRVKAYSSGGTSGGVLSGGSTTTLSTTVTYDTATTFNSGDKLWVGGFNDSGRTAKTLTISGTFAATIGDNTGTAQGNGFLGAIDNALTVGAGGKVELDKTASSTVTIAGSINTYGDGIYDGGSSTSNSAVINTTIFDNSVNGSWGIMQAAQGRGGQYLFDGYQYDVYSTYASGVGTAANPLILNTAVNWTVGCEIVIGASGIYTENEVRYIKTVNSSTSFVLSTTPGGAEAALTYTHAAGVHVANLTKNCVVKPVSTSLGYKAYIQHASLTNTFKNMRFEYPSGGSSHGLNLEYLVNNSASSTISNVVLYGNSAGNRGVLRYQTFTATKTTSGIVGYNQLATNLANAAIELSGASNQTFTDCFIFNGAGATNNGQGLALNLASNGNVFNNVHIYGANSNNTTSLGGLTLSSSNLNTFNNCSINASRQQGIYMTSALGNVFNNCAFANRYTNVVDIGPAASTYNTALFNSCTFGSPTLVSGYLSMLDGSEIAFHQMDGNNNKHRWYNSHGSGWASGTGLTETTVRTASSLALACKPEDNSAGFYWETTIPQNPTSQVGIFGYVYRNATFSSGTLKVELFLEGSSTADATYTFPTTTGSWLPFNISAYYSGSLTRLARVRITGVTATAGAYFFVDDLYDAGTGNKVAGLDLWYQGKPSPVIAAIDTSAIPAQVWGFSDQTTSANTMGKRQVDAADNAELAAIT